MKKFNYRRPRNLTTREYCCVLVAALYTIGEREEAGQFLERAVNGEGASPRMIEELFLHISLLLGFPAMLDGLARLREIVPPTAGRFSGKGQKRDSMNRRGRRVLGKIYGKATDRLLDNLSLLHTIVPSIVVGDAYGGIISRPGLSLREREIVNVVVLLAQRLDRQLYSHIRGAMRIGVSPETLRSVIVLTARLTRSNPRTAREMLSALAGSRKSLR